ncbi:hypothetical protein DPMN_037939 [Dreissena polymorpha]|uniref:Uncharacterized protein n=1 Tax=Dreissena polymorpha TaxID=45954 RepID=A0A9D4MEB2_DREPO|nr:hypothetical protein DPMN_037939 [Dreissena polymorpha]
MQELTGRLYEASKECGKSRQSRDGKDIQRMINYLTDRNLFTTEEKSLRSISSRVVAGDKVNADKGRAVGERIIKVWKGRTFKNINFPENHRLKQ